MIFSLCSSDAEPEKKEVAPEAVDTKEERDQIAEAVKEEKEVTEELNEIKEEIKKEKKIASVNEKKEKLTDLGILIVIIGLLILVLTTYLTGSLDLSYTITNYLVIGALVVELVGIIIIIVNSIRKK